LRHVFAHPAQSQLLRLLRRPAVRQHEHLDTVRSINNFDKVARVLGLGDPRGFVGDRLPIAKGAPDAVVQAQVTTTNAAATTATNHICGLGRKPTTEEPAGKSYVRNWKRNIQLAFVIPPFIAKTSITATIFLIFIAASVIGLQYTAAYARYRTDRHLTQERQRMNAR